ncbi:MAG: hypothetical protein RBR86_05230 [Pseudobdellovibrionaceae bacterium]|nr:hypothetical protein [Pseudobdellovibrionaceae bacterium]
MASGSFDFRSFQKYFGPQASGDLNIFLEKMPQNAGKGALIAAGISWGMVAALGLFCVMQMKSLTDLRAELLQSEALKPAVPTISYETIDKKALDNLIEDFRAVYPGMTFTVTKGSLAISSRSTSDYARFREILGHIVNAGPMWRVGVESICVGRECKTNALEAKVKIQKLKIDKPSSSSTM